MFVLLCKTPFLFFLLVSYYHIIFRFVKHFLRFLAIFFPENQFGEKENTHRFRSTGG